MAEKDLNINVRIKKTTSSSSSKSTTEEDPKVQTARQRAADKEKLESLKATLREKQSLLDADIRKTQTLLESAKAKELEAERQGNRMKIKEAIHYRKIMESQLRLLEADKRLANSKDLAEFKENLRKKAAAERQYQSSLKNAPRTKLSGDIGSLSYTRQIERSLGGMTAGTQEYVQTEALLKRYRTQLTGAGVDVRNISQKIGGEFTSSLSKHRSELMNNLRASGLWTIGLAGMTAGLVRFSSESIKAFIADERFSKSFLGSAENMHQFRIAVANTVDDDTLGKLSNQATNLGISFDQQVKMFKASRIAAKQMGIEIPQAFEMILNSTEGAVKGLTKLGLSKTKYNEILKDLVKSAKGEIELTDIGNGQKELTIKNLTAEEQQKIRVLALNQLMEETLGDLNNTETDNYEKTEQLANIWGEMKEGFGGGLLSGILDVAGALDKGTDSAESQIKTMGLLKDAAQDLGQFMALGFVGNFAKWQHETSLKIGDVLKDWLGLKTEMETPIVANVEIVTTESDWSDLNRQWSDIGNNPNAVDLREQWKKHPINEALRPKKNTNRGGKSQNVKDREEELNLVKLQEIELAKLNKQLEKNLGDVGAELDLKIKIRDVEREIKRLREGDPLIAITPKIQGQSGIEAYQGVGITRRDGNFGRDAGIEQALRIQEIYDQIDAAYLQAFEQSFSIVQQIGSILGDGAGDVINAFQQAYSLTQAIIALINTLNTVASLFDVIPGVGSALKAIARADGGEIDKGMLYQWNEDGKELFIASQSGYVLNAHNFAKFTDALSTMGAAMANNNRANNYVNMYQGKSGTRAAVPNVQVFVESKIGEKASYQVLIDGMRVMDFRGTGEI